MASQKHVHVHVVYNDSTGTTDNSAGTNIIQRTDGVQENHRRLDISLLQKGLHNAMAGFFDAR